MPVGHDEKIRLAEAPDRQDTAQRRGVSTFDASSSWPRFLAEVRHEVVDRVSAIEGGG